MENKILILLSTYNGKKYLKEQLNSLYSQSYKNFELIVRDDGSVDITVEILKDYNIEKLIVDKNIGIKKSFETLLKYAYENSDAEYFMFSDQDDVWDYNKVEITLKKMQNLEKFYGKDIPLLIHTDLEVVDEKLLTINNSMWKSGYINPDFNTLNKLLIQNTVTGCTMMINRKLVQKSLIIPENAIMHDWWIALIAAVFGKIGYVDETTIKYRQHGKNDIGAKNYDYKFILNKLKKYNEINIDKNIFQAKVFLELFKDELDEYSKKMLEDFSKIKEKSYLLRVYILFKYNLFKYGFVRNIGLILKI